MLTDLVELRTLRLDRGWTYRTLAAKINAVSPTHIGHTRLFVLLNEPDERPNDLTAHGIRLFLDSVKKRKRRSARAKGAAA